MALTDGQVAEVEQLKRLVGDVDLDDDSLYAYIATNAGMNSAAAAVWQYKAAQAADLIDVKEGSSSRSLSQLRANSLAMEAYFRGLGDGTTATGGTGAQTRSTRLGR